MSVTLDPIAHRYSDESGRQYVSVSKIIQECYPEKTWGDAPIERVEYARNRGVAVEAYFNQYLLAGTVDVPAGEMEDRLDYLQRLVAWWEKNDFADVTSKYKVEVQAILSDKVNGIAGSADLLLHTTKRTLIDIKCVYELQKSYVLQCGAYTDMSASERCGCLWVSKTAVQFVEYDAKDAVESWRDAKNWYLRKQKIEATKKVKRVA